MRVLVSEVSCVKCQEPGSSETSLLLPRSLSPLELDKSSQDFKGVLTETSVPHYPSTLSDFNMERVKVRATKTTSNTPEATATSQGSKSPREHHSMCDKREKLKQGKRMPHPVLHPDVANAQMEANSVIRFSEDSRPMFSPIPRNHSSDTEGDDSPRTSSGRSGKEKSAFPSIHVEKCEKAQPAYASVSPEPVCHSPESDMEVDNEVMSTSQSSGGLNVPSPYLHRKSDGRVVLVTQDSNRGMLSSWSRSEGNLPEAVRRSHSTPGSHSHLLDIKYRPDWHPRPTLRQSSDVALHELRRRGRGVPPPPQTDHTPVGTPQSQHRRQVLSATNLQSP